MQCQRPSLPCFSAPRPPSPGDTVLPKEWQVTGWGGGGDWGYLPNTRRRFLRRMQVRHSLPSALSCQSGTITEPGAGGLAMAGHWDGVGDGRMLRAGEGRGLLSQAGPMSPLHLPPGSASPSFLLGWWSGVEPTVLITPLASFQSTLPSLSWGVTHPPLRRIAQKV